ncbi:helix-turn-helix domain-containing protein [Fulvivirgaceae bacterium BMA10]|uniref:Helix-turn-helix domain-containing protein n=1 Tax=Splendidivirga corallicola TaxID=3051826 RepID=A0ABT8KMQ0_9BACT|nr:helix-turn-helix domain-containing protein [Fulvivirgaceae bacterium BMA10]
MDLDYNWINLLILFGALQGLIFSIILLLNKKHPGAKFLGVFMFGLAYNGFETFNWSSHLSDHIIFFDLFPFVMIYTLGPSLYLYILSLLYPEKKLTPIRILTYYFPPIFQFVFRISVIVVYFLVRNKVLFDKAALESLDSVYYFYAEAFSIIVFLIYLYLSLKLFIRAHASYNISSVSKEVQQKIYKWIKALLFCMIVLGLAWPLTVSAPYFFDLSYNVHYYPIELILVIFIYWIGFVGYLRINMIFPLRSRFLHGSISTSMAKQWMIQLQSAMENDKLYLDPGLNRSKVAAYIGINPKIISVILNQHSRQNFNDFVNTYRVEEVCKKLLSTKNRHLTISGIALESGFNSQATFQRAFKNIKGISPKEYQTLKLKKIG